MKMSGEPYALSHFFLSNKSLGGPQSPSGRFGEQKNQLPLPVSELRVINTRLHATLQQFAGDVHQLES